MGAVAPTTAVHAAVVDSMAPIEAADSTLAAEDIPAARVFGARGRPLRDRWVAARLAGLPARPIVRTAIPGTSVADHWAQMALGISIPRLDEGYLAPTREQWRRARTRLVGISARIGLQAPHRPRGVGPVTVSPPGPVHRDRRPPSTRTDVQMLHHFREVGRVSPSPPCQVPRDQHLPSTQIGPRVLCPLRGVGLAKVNSPPRIRSDRSLFSIAIAALRILKTLDSVIPHSAIPRAPTHETGRAPLGSVVPNWAARINMTSAELPPMERTRSAVMSYRSFQIYLAWRWISALSACGVWGCLEPV